MSLTLSALHKEDQGHHALYSKVRVECFLWVSLHSHTFIILSVTLLLLAVPSSFSGEKAPCELEEIGCKGQRVPIGSNPLCPASVPSLWHSALDICRLHRLF